MSQLTDTFSAIANAIRGKLGVSTTYKPSQMASAINSIVTSRPFYVLTAFGIQYTVHGSGGPPTYYNVTFCFTITKSVYDSLTSSRKRCDGCGVQVTMMSSQPGGGGGGEDTRGISSCYMYKSGSNVYFSVEYSIYGNIQYANGRAAVYTYYS